MTTQPADPLREALDALEAEAKRAYAASPSVASAAYAGGVNAAVQAVRTALGDHATLGSAWASVEAALPEGHGFAVSRAAYRDVEDENGERQYTAWLFPFGQYPTVTVFGPTPTAALLALHAALTEKKP